MSIDIDVAPITADCTAEDHLPIMFRAALAVSLKLVETLEGVSPSRAVSSGQVREWLESHHLGDVSQLESVFVDITQRERAFLLSRGRPVGMYIMCYCWGALPCVDHLRSASWSAATCHGAKVGIALVKNTGKGIEDSPAGIEECFEGMRAIQRRPRKNAYLHKRPHRPPSQTQCHCVRVLRENRRYPCRCPMPSPSASAHLNAQRKKRTEVQNERPASRKRTVEGKLRRAVV